MPLYSPGPDNKAIQETRDALVRPWYRTALGWFAFIAMLAGIISCILAISMGSWEQMSETKAVVEIPAEEIVTATEDSRIFAIADFNPMTAKIGDTYGAWTVTDIGAQNDMRQVIYFAGEEVVQGEFTDEWMKPGEVCTEKLTPETALHLPIDWFCFKDSTEAIKSVPFDRAGVKVRIRDFVYDRGGGEFVSDATFVEVVE